MKFKNGAYINRKDSSISIKEYEKDFQNSEIESITSGIG